MNQQILAAYKKHYGEWNENGRDYNMFASGWLEAQSVADAAPLLLAACKVALDALDEYTSWQEAARVQIRAAIAAAKGLEE